MAYGKTIKIFLIDGGWLAKVSNGPQTKYSKTSKKLPDQSKKKEFKCRISLC